MLKHASSVAALVVGSMALGAPTASGAVLAEYTFSPALNPPTYSFAAANVTASAVGKGSQTVIGPSNNFYLSAPFMIVSRNGDTPANAWIEMTITAAAGYELDLTSFTFDGARGGASTPRSYDLRSSVTGLLLSNPSLGSGSFDYARPASNGVMPTFTVDLSSPAYQDLSSLTMRMYISTPGVSQNIDLDNIVFNGAVNAVVPEPTTAALLSIAGAAFVMRKRKG